MPSNTPVPTTPPDPTDGTGQVEPPAPVPTVGRAADLAAWPAAAAELATLGWTASEIAELAEQPLDDGALAAVMQTEREIASGDAGDGDTPPAPDTGEGDGSTPTDSGNGDDVTSDVPTDSPAEADGVTGAAALTEGIESGFRELGYTDEQIDQVRALADEQQLTTAELQTLLEQERDMQAVAAEYTAKFQELGMPEEIIGAYLQSALQTGDPAALATAYEQAAERVTWFRAEGWFEDLESVGMDPLMVWQAAIGLPTPDPVGQPLPTDDNDDLRGLYNAYAAARSRANMSLGGITSVPRLGNLALSLLPGGRLGQFIAGKEPLSGERIDQTSPLEIGLAALSGLALIPLARGARTIYKGGTVLRGMRMGAVPTGGLSAGTVGALEASGVKFGLKVRAGLALADDSARAWRGAGKAATESRIADLTRVLDDAVTNGAEARVIDSLKGAIGSLQRDIKFNDELLAAIESGNVLPTTGKQPWLPRVFGRIRNPRHGVEPLDTIHFEKFGQLHSPGAAGGGMPGVGGMGKSAGGDGIDKLVFSRRFSVGKRPDVLSSHLTSASWERALTDGAKVADDADIAARIGRPIDATDLLTMPYQGLGRVAEAQGLGTQGTGLLSKIFRSSTKDAADAARSVSAEYGRIADDLLNAGISGGAGAPAAGAAATAPAAASTAGLTAASGAADDALRSTADALAARAAGTPVASAPAAAADDAARLILESKWATEPVPAVDDAIAGWIANNPGYQFVKAHWRTDAAGADIWHPAVFRAAPGHAGLPTLAADDVMRGLAETRPDVVWRAASPSTGVQGYFQKAAGWGERSVQDALAAHLDASLASVRQGAAAAS